MHSHLLNNYSGIDSPVHRLPATLKLIAAITTILLLIAMPPTAILFSLVFAALFLIIAISRIPLGFLARRMLFLEPFVLGVSVLSLLQPHGGHIFILLFTRTTLCLLTIVLLSNTTAFSDILKVLRYFRVPMLMVTTLALMYRYLYVLGEETERMRPGAGKPIVHAQPMAHLEQFGDDYRAALHSLQRAGRSDLCGHVCPGVAMTPALEVRNLRYHYPDGTVALNGVNFAIAPGECVGLIGPNGAGKSTLLLHLNGILPDDNRADAAVLIDGESATRKNLLAIRRKVGLLFQDPDDQLFCASVFEDVAFGPQQFGIEKSRLEGIVGDCLAKVGLAGFEKRSPHRLSGGEKRRVCLAGVLACEPVILVLDEPTSNLDPRGRSEIKALLRTIPSTKIIATHDLEIIVELCPRSILLDHGQIVADGATVELLSNELLMLAHGLEKPHILQHQHPHGCIPT